MFNKLQPYVTLVSQNHNYRRLWLSQVISNFGDWFGLLAVYALITHYTDSDFLLGLIIVIKMLSLAGFSPFAGYIADRFNRRRLMIFCDVGRMLLVLALLLISSRESLWLAYALTAFQMMLSAMFEPARTSSIPNVTTPEELVSANVLSSASWSIIFSIGMGLGGLATGWFGTDAVFIINALSYLLSAWFIYRAYIPQQSMSSKERERTRNPLIGIKEGFHYLKENKQILRPVIAKGYFTMSLGALTYILILVSDQILLMGSIGLGLLYSARGIGTGVGPIVSQHLFPRESDWIKIIGFCMIFSGLMYIVVGATGSFFVMLCFVLLAHSSSGANWMMSTVLLQRRTPDVFRGRIFSTEWLLNTLAQSISVLTASILLENEVIGIQNLIIVFSILLIFGGIIWTLTITQQEQIYHKEGQLREGIERKIPIS